jgi:Ankyrin repeats (3 copies)/Ankyrin repeat
MFNRFLCPIAFVMLPIALLAQPPDKIKDGDRNPPKNETVMSPGMRIRVTTPVGAIEVTAVDELTRSYTWDGATRSVEMWPRAERWNGSLGLYYPGPGEHWNEHKGITRGVTEEGQQHFKSAEEAVAWIRKRSWMPYVYRDDGMMVGWSKTLPRRQLNVEVWQILVDGKKPGRLPGSENDKIVVTNVELATSPLGKAVQKNDARAVKALLAEGADPNAKNIVGRPLLIEAAKRGYHDIVRALLDKGAHPNARSEDDLTALLAAAEAGHVETVRALLASKADIDLPRERGLIRGTTPLIAAASAGKAEVVKVLLEKGANVNAKMEVSGNLTALYLAREGKYPEVVRLLKEAGAKE